MGFRDRLVNYFSKGEFARLQKDNAIAMTRPGLGRFEKAQEQMLYHLQNTSYFFENEVSIFSEVLLSLRREIFRNGIDWQPKFVVKCLKCGNEMDEKLERCDFCGSSEMREPNAAERMVFLYGDGTSKILKINDNNQSLGEVLAIAERHLDVADLAYLICQKVYELNPDGSIDLAIPKEIIAADPRDIEFIHDELGNPGTKGRICIRHRDKLQAQNATKCAECGGVLYEVHYKGGKLSGKARSYIDGEVLMFSKYNPSLVGGYPEVMKMADDVWAYHFIEKRVRSYYEKARVPGILTIPTNNPDSAYKTWKDCMTELRGDPYGVPWLNYDPEAKAPINYLKLMDDPNAQMLEIKKEIRERMGARFGVSMIFQADTSTSGGLNNEGLQITVTNRAVEWGQSLLNEKPLRWICQQWGIKDWVLELNPSEEQDEMAEIQRLQASVQIAQTMLQMGFEVEYEDGEFKYSGHAKKNEPPPMIPGQSPFGGQPPEQGQTQEPSGSPQEGPDIGGVLSAFPELKTKANCPPNLHSHQDFEEGRCHSSTQVHRTGQSQWDKPSPYDTLLPEDVAQENREAGAEVREIPQTQLEDAYKKMRSVDPECNITIRPGNANVETIDHYTHGLEEIKKKNIKLPRSIDVNSVFFNRFGTEKQQVPAFYVPQWDTLYLNPRDQSSLAHRKYAKMVSRRNYLAKFHSTENEFHDIRHEIGHRIQHTTSKETARAALTYRDPKSWVSPEDKSLVESEVGKYAGYDPTEFVAETIAGLMDGKKYSPKLMELFTKYSGGVGTDY